MNDSHHPSTTSPAGVPLVPPRWPWLAPLNLALLVMFVVLLFFPLFAQPPGPQMDSSVKTGWRVLCRIPPFLLLLLALVAMSLADMCHRPTRRTPLDAFVLELFRLILMVGILVPFADELVISRQHSGDALRIRSWHGLWGLAAFTVLPVIQSVWLSCHGGLLHFVRQLRRRPPWKRWNWWLLPVTVGAIVVTLGGAAWVIHMVAEELGQPPYSLASAVRFVVLAWVALYLVLISLTALAVWERRAWAPWALLALMVPAVWMYHFILAVTRFFGALSSVYDIIEVAAIAWCLYSVIVGLILSPGWFQRARCAACSRLCWMRSRRCPVCGNLYRLHRDHAAAPVCLACGHEAAAAPVCRPCAETHAGCPGGNRNALGQTSAPILLASHALLVPRPGGLWAILDLVFFWGMIVSLFLPFARGHGYQDYLGRETVTGVQLAFHFPPLLMAIVALGVLVHAGLRRHPDHRTPLEAFAIELLRLHLILGTGLLLGTVGSGPLTGQDTKVHFGAYIVLVATGVMLVLQLGRMVAFGGLFRLVRSLRRRPPWKHWNWWLFSLAVPVGLIVLAGLGLMTFALITVISEFRPGPGYFRPSWWEFIIILSLLGWVALHFVALAMALLALWERRGWAVGAYLLLTSMILGTMGYAIWETGRYGGGPPSGMSYLLWTLTCFVLCLTTYGTVVGLCLTGQRWRRGPCAVCGEQRWIRAARCSVCGERYWIHKDHAAAPVCLACGHEAGAGPVCRSCGC